MKFSRSSNVLIFHIIIVVFRSLKVLSQSASSKACLDLFQYQSYGNSYFGKITLYNIPLAKIKVEAEFSQREPLRKTFNGRLSLFDDLQTTQFNLQNGQPISYRVDFPNPNTLPKLTSIKVNDQTLCFDYGFSSPSSVFKMHHIFFPSEMVLSRPIYPNSVVNNFNPNQELFDKFPTGSHNNTFISNTPMLYPTDTDNSPGYTNNNVLIIKTPLQLPAITETMPEIQSKPFPIQQNNPFFSSRPSIINTSSKFPTILNTTTSRYPEFGSNIRSQTTTSQPFLNSASSCGEEGTTLTPFIVGGHDLERGRFPWLTAIYIRQSADLKFICGGSLISARTVITAAHCFMDNQITAERIIIYLGRHNLYVSENGVKQRNIQRLIKHPEFNVSAMADADIALLQMRRPVSFTQYIRPICLWSTTDSDSNQVIYHVAGWGSNNNGVDVTPIPKVVEVNIVDEAECLRSSDIFRLLTSARSLCAGKRDGTGPCNGDSGGGLMFNNAGAWTLRAIVSLGITKNLNNRRACNLNEYVVYCDLAKHLKWLHQNML